MLSLLSAFFFQFEAASSDFLFGTNGCMLLWLYPYFSFSIDFVRTIHCFLLHIAYAAVKPLDDTVTFDQSEHHCYNLFNSHLASIHSDSDTSAIFNLRDSLGFLAVDEVDHCWIGLHIDRGTNGSNWTWTDGTDFDYTNWRTDEPNNDDGNENCVSLHSIDTTRWNDVLCERQYSCFVCNNPVFSTVTRNDSDHIVVKAEHARYSWLDANEYCNESYATTLASIGSDTENEALIQLIQSFDASDCWIGWKNGTWIDDNSVQFDRVVSGANATGMCAKLGARTNETERNHLDWVLDDCANIETDCWVCNKFNPTVSPTYFPSIVPTFGPTAGPTLATEGPSAPPSWVPTFLPTILPTAGPVEELEETATSTSTTFVASDDEADTTAVSEVSEESKKDEDMIEFLGLDLDRMSFVFSVFLGVFVCVVCFVLVLGYVHMRVDKTYDDVNYLGLMIYFMQVFDFYSDVNFCVFLGNEGTRSSVGLFVASLVFILLPWLYNVVELKLSCMYNLACGFEKY